MSVGATSDREARIRLDLAACARHLLQHPLLCQEDDPARFRLIRRYEHELDRWFAQRLGYRLHVGSDTVRLFKSTVVANRRPLRTTGSSPRPLSVREYTLLCLVLAAVAAGPRVISLRDLIQRLREAAGDAGIALREEASERRSLITAIQWMIGNGLVRELHERVDRYVIDDQADAVIEVVPDRVALLPLRSLGSAESEAELCDRPGRLLDGRQWMRARLVEDGVLYRHDLDPGEWRELRRRLGDEANLLGEMFGLRLEARAEGVAAIDPEGQLTDQPLPAGGTVGHAALVLLERLCREPGGATGEDPIVPRARVVELLVELAAENPQWSKLADEPARLAGAVLALLADHRLVEPVDGVETGTARALRVRPLAHRFAVEVVADLRDGAEGGGGDQGRSAVTDDQGSLW